MKFEVDKELIEEMSEIIFDCHWVSAEEVTAYMLSCITDEDNYTPEEWSVDGRGIVAIDRSTIKQPEE